MKTVLMAIILLTKPVFKKEYPALSELRRLFNIATVQRDSCNKFSALLSQIDSNSQPLYICYKGVSNMIQAKYAVNPVVKYSLFNKGKVLIETAIKTDTNNIEMRYLRLSVQNNLPLLLGYSKNIEPDKSFLRDNIKNENDTELKELITNYLLSLNNF